MQIFQGKFNLFLIRYCIIHFFVLSLHQEKLITIKNYTIMKNLFFWSALIIAVISMVLGLYFLFCRDIDKSFLWFLFSGVFGVIMTNSIDDKKNNC